MDLNPAQAAAVAHGEGPLLILAGAGSGKTRVITARIAELLRRAVPPWRILAVTFTNKAAGEMKERMEAQNGVDFGDLILKTLNLCEKDAEIGPKLAQKFQHVLVDEFQDTNRTQYRLVHHLSSATGNLCVVGDDDQSIYGWRGADLRNILDFEADHPGTVTVKPEQNYRSTQVILDAANAVIARNLQRKPKRLFTEQLGGDTILYHTAEDERRESDWVVRAIERLEHDEGRTPD